MLDNHLYTKNYGSRIREFIAHIENFVDPKWVGLSQEDFFKKTRAKTNIKNLQSCIIIRENPRTKTNIKILRDCIIIRENMDYCKDKYMLLIHIFVLTQFFWNNLFDLF